jgi:phosphoribosylformylglycinamidine cyclo-ligase
MTVLTYKDAGVDISLADDFLKEAKSAITGTFTRGVLHGIGHFGAFFQPEFSKMKEPVLIASTDGVGTKLKVAGMMGIHNTVGQDLVNHCVNDILCAGATPLFFMDYLALGKMDKAVALDLITGICQSAKENGVAVIGGETAEMPDLYQIGDYDLAGTIVGVVDKSDIINGNDISAGDVLIALPSNGLHTNGYSLARKICFELKKFYPDDFIPELNSSIGWELLKVHRSYLKPVSSLMKMVKIKGLSHITGGGIEGNTMRIIPKGLSLDLDWNSWEIPPIFRLLQGWGKVPLDDMRRTFNLGIGMIIIIAPKDSNEAINILQSLGEKPIEIGIVRKLES